MTPGYVLAHTIPAALALLPSRMDTIKARAMLLAIGLQESKFLHRRQIGGGPGRSHYQFEQGGGILGVLTHEKTAHHARAVCTVFTCKPTSKAVHLVIGLPKYDVLACAFARLLLWTLPEILPDRNNAALGWYQYNRAWRPGKPHPETWAGHWETAWKLVTP